MNVFDPRTFSSDWELLVVDRLNRCIDSERLMGFADALRAELDLPVQVDWNSIEFALGVNTSLAQIQERIQRLTDRATQFLREYELDLYPAGGHPVDMMFSSSHIHVGTIRDETQGIHLENQLFRYVPVFAALAANSPMSQRRLGEYKSYRVRYMAHGCTRPASARDPHMAQSTWGSDAAPKVYGAPTLEVRVCDCASSRRFQAELAVFVAAYVHYQGTRLRVERPTADEYRHFLINRWSAARYGMQASLHWQDGTRTVAEVLDEMLDECAETLQVLGASRADLPLINLMIEKRLCQADCYRQLIDRYPEVYGLASAYGKVLRHWTYFDDYLASAQPLEPLPAPDEDAVLAQHLAMIGEGTSFYRSRDAMYFPPPLADEQIERMVALGMIRREVTPDRGIVLSRI